MDFFTVNVSAAGGDVKGPGVTGVVLVLSFLRPGLVGLDNLELSGPSISAFQMLGLQV